VIAIVKDGTNQGLFEWAVHPMDEGAPIQTDALLLGDAYCRQNDLIAHYPEVEPWRFGYQMDVRWVAAESSKDWTCLEIWLSIQTSLLESSPQLTLSFSKQSFHVDREGLWTSLSHRIGLMVHPLDRKDCVVDVEKDSLEMTVFGRFMEKGVIRRMRFRLVVSTNAQPATFWKDRQHEFSNSPLPLTT
jgi:hypothetical protein